MLHIETPKHSMKKKGQLLPIKCKGASRKIVDTFKKDSKRQMKCFGLTKPCQNVYINTQQLVQCVNVLVIFFINFPVIPFKIVS